MCFNSCVLIRVKYLKKKSTEKEMKEHSQPEDTLDNKEVEVSAAENLKCLYLCSGYFAQPKKITILESVRPSAA